jgi:hypothetical protein
MQIIYRNQANECVFTVTENATLSNPYWLFELKGSQDNQVKRFVAQNTTTYSDRYDLFTITESSAENLLTGTVSLPYVAEYYYKIWEQTSPTNLNPANATSICEEGIIRVYESPDSIVQNNNTDDSLIVYGG